MLFIPVAGALEHSSMSDAGGLNQKAQPLQSVMQYQQRSCVTLI
jgi:hypothetical protein